VDKGAGRGERCRKLGRREEEGWGGARRPGLKGAT